MGITQRNDGEGVILTDEFYLQGKRHREKITLLLGGVLQEKQFQVGPFSAPRGLWIDFLQYFHMHLHSLVLHFHSFLSRQRAAFNQRSAALAVF